jgi:hypothetical protein
MTEYSAGVHENLSESSFDEIAGSSAAMQYSQVRS